MSRILVIEDDQRIRELVCKHLAEENSTMGGNIVYWLLSPMAQNQYAVIYKKCMEGRNHQVLN